MIRGKVQGRCGCDICVVRSRMERLVTETQATQALRDIVTLRKDRRARRTTASTPWISRIANLLLQVVRGQRSRCTCRAAHAGPPTAAKRLGVLVSCRLRLSVILQFPAISRIGRTNGGHRPWEPTSQEVTPWRRPRFVISTSLDVSRLDSVSRGAIAIAVRRTSTNLVK